MIKDYEGFKSEVLRLIGIDLNSYKERQMKRRIDSLIQKNGFADYEQYVTQLKVNKTLLDEFINFLTINVSEFFRNPNQWTILEKEILPNMLKNNAYPKIWSSACSTGEEPYTLAMILSNFMPTANVKILATDIDKEVMAKAKAGVYSAKAVEGVPKEYLSKYFTKVDDNYVVCDAIKRCIEFKQVDLLKDQYPTNCDLIVCRNVLIYFTEEAKNLIYKKFNNALKSNGVLFVGSTEQIIMSQNFKFSPIKTFFYQKTI